MRTPPRNDPVQRILTALRERGHEPRKSGGGGGAGWCCTCPAHDDQSPSLSIGIGDDGRALVNCHAGCSVDAVCGAIGLRPADLFIPDPSRRNGHAPKTRRRGERGGGDETPGNAGIRVASVTVATVAKPSNAGDGWGEL